MQALLTRIILFGQDIDKLKDFYLMNFNLTVIEETEHLWVVLNAGAVEIGLHRVGEAYLTTNKAGFKANSNTKLVFSIDTDLNLFRQNLIIKGVSMGEIRSYAPNMLHCDGEDPEGNVFQLAWKINDTA